MDFEQKVSDNFSTREIGKENKLTWQASKN